MLEEYAILGDIGSVQLTEVTTWKNEAQTVPSVQWAHQASKYALLLHLAACHLRLA
jgi:hypothetical protein